jgi:alpha-L-fucosidase 2
MDYELLLRATASGGSVSCASVPVLSNSTPLTGQTPANATISIRGARSVTLTWVGGTSYDMSAGDAAHNFSFKGTDPHATLVKLLSSATGQSYNIARSAHVKDFTSVLGSFSLDIGQDRVPSATTDVLLADYQVDTGNPYLEWLTFNYGRYMLASSARGVLPANLQGKWANGAGAPWSGGRCFHPLF